MLFLKTLTTERQIKSLSERIKNLTRGSNAYLSYNDSGVKSENLRLNLSLIISHIILNLNFVDRSKKEFVHIITKYNKANNTTIIFEDFKEINWIREIAGEIVFPALVGSFISKVTRSEKAGEVTIIPEEKKHLIRCLQAYYEDFFEDSKLTITKEELEDILAKHAPKEATVDYLVKREIIGFNSQNTFYFKSENEFTRHLRNEIASTLWLLVGGEKATEVEFRKYFKLVKTIGLWVDNLNNFLSAENTNRIYELATAFLASEVDLLKSNDEFSKIWLDAYPHSYYDIDAKIPIVEFNFDNTFDFIESVNFHKWRFPEIFDYQKTRSYCDLLLRIVVHNDPMGSSAYESILKILKDTSRPSLIWILYQDMPTIFPETIPYLITDSDLAPIAFRLIDEISINNSLLLESSNNDKQIEEAWEVKDQLWHEMFDITLDNLSALRSQYENGGEMIAKILLNISKNVFNLKFNNSNRQTTIHSKLRKRYDSALKKLSNKRVNVVNIHPQPLITPRLIFSILPSISEYLITKTPKQSVSHTEYLNLNSDFFDVCIEVLRFTNIRFSEAEISKEERTKIGNVSNELVALLESILNQFYSQVEVDVLLYDPPGTEKRKSKRGINDFGIEILDWGYLYLHIEKYALLKKIDKNFKKSINFNSNKSKYDEQNKEQIEKLKFYLKSMMIAFISINQKKSLYEIEGLPVKTTLDQLEYFIKTLSVTYSIDEISKSKVDIFNERSNYFTYNIYYQPLTSLLYQCVNFFKPDSQNSFIQDFFTKSIDIGRMLAAVNILDSKEPTEIISTRIKNINIEDFIKSNFTTNELETALIEAINSEHHWGLAKPLLERLQNHFKRLKPNDVNNNILLFEVNLILAFKERDLDKIVSLSVPMNVHHSKENKKWQDIKRFFIALFKIYHEKKYDEGILHLKSLLSQDARNIRYAFHLYRAETLKAIETL